MSAEYGLALAQNGEQRKGVRLKFCADDVHLPVGLHFRLLQDERAWIQELFSRLFSAHFS
jgi:hypothetical protein